MADIQKILKKLAAGLPKTPVPVPVSQATSPKAGTGVKTVGGPIEPVGGLTLRPYGPRVTQYNKYRVQRGDTLGGLANKHGIPLEIIRSVNGIAPNSNNIRVGQTLHIPVEPPEPQIKPHPGIARIIHGPNPPHLTEDQIARLVDIAADTSLKASYPTMPEEMRKELSIKARYQPKK